MTYNLLYEKLNNKTDSYKRRIAGSSISVYTPTHAIKILFEMIYSTMDI
jgi:hypothetical protein